MQSDTPQGDPQLQRTTPGPKIATGYVDPCIVYMESTGSGEIPVLITLWAGASTEVQEAGEKIHLKLTDVVVLHWRTVNASSGWSVRNQKPLWLYASHREKSLLVSSRGEKFVVEPPLGRSGVKSTSADHSFQGSICFIDEKTDASLRKLLAGNWSAPVPLAKKILKCANVDWPSIAEALASLEHRKPRIPRPSLVRRLLSSVFKKKPKPVAV